MSQLATALVQSDTTGAFIFASALITAGIILMLACAVFIRMRRRDVPPETPMTDRGRAWHRLATAHDLSYATSLPLFPNSGKDKLLGDGVFGQWKGFPVRAGDEGDATTVAAARCGHVGPEQSKGAGSWLKGELNESKLEVHGSWLLVRVPHCEPEQLPKLFDATIGCVLHLGVPSSPS